MWWKRLLVLLGFPLWAALWLVTALFMFTGIPWVFTGDFFSLVDWVEDVWSDACDWARA